MLAIARVGGERVYVPTHRDEAAMDGAPGVFAVYVYVYVYVAVYVAVYV